MISIIAAITKDRVLGRDNKLLWHISEDMRRFRSITAGHTVIMGRKTFESIGKPLPNRRNIVVTRDEHFSYPGVVVAHSLEAAYKLANAKDNEEVFVIGGGQLYAQAINDADKLYLTVVDGVFSGDVFFPDYSMFAHTTFEKGSKEGDYTFTFLELTKQ